MDEYDDLLFHVSSGDYIIESFDSNKGVAGIYFEQPYLLTFVDEGKYEIEIKIKSWHNSKYHIYWNVLSFIYGVYFH